jgi:hypothetical protein
MPRFIPCWAFALDAVRAVVAFEMQDFFDTGKMQTFGQHVRQVVPSHLVDFLMRPQHFAGAVPERCSTVHIINLTLLAVGSMPPA